MLFEREASTRSLCMKGYWDWIYKDPGPFSGFQAKSQWEVTGDQREEEERNERKESHQGIGEIFIQTFSEYFSFCPVLPLG